MPTKNYHDFCPGSLLEIRAEILVIFGWHFGRNDDLINSPLGLPSKSHSVIAKSFVAFLDLPNTYCDWVILIINLLKKGRQVDIP
jgi:hypothetical protein